MIRASISASSSSPVVSELDGNVSQTCGEWTTDKVGDEDWRSSIGNKSDHIELKHSININSISSILLSNCLGSEKSSFFSSIKLELDVSVVGIVSSQENSGHLNDCPASRCIIVSSRSVVN